MMICLWHRIIECSRMMTEYSRQQTDAFASLLLVENHPLLSPKKRCRDHPRPNRRLGSFVPQTVAGYHGKPWSQATLAADRAFLGFKSRPRARLETGRMVDKKGLAKDVCHKSWKNQVADGCREIHGPYKISWLKYAYRWQHNAAYGIWMQSDT